MSPPVLAQVTSLTRLSAPGLRLLTRCSALLGVPHQIAPRAAWPVITSPRNPDGCRRAPCSPRTVLSGTCSVGRRGKQRAKALACYLLCKRKKLSSTYREWVEVRKKRENQAGGRGKSTQREGKQKQRRLELRLHCSVLESWPTAPCP